jgi:hypothetical protein
MFARPTQSDASKGRVDKTTYTFTRPWCITATLKEPLYKHEHCSTSHRKEKKYASNLSLYLLELIPFQPLDGPDTQYGQLHKPITAHPFKEADINRFNPITHYTLQNICQLPHDQPGFRIPLAKPIEFE